MTVVATIKSKLPFTPNKHVTVSLLLGFVVLLLFTASRPSFLEASLLHKVNEVTEDEEDSDLSNTAWPLAVEQRRRIASIIADVQREIHRLAGKKATIDSKWSVKLAAVAEELDPRISLSGKTHWDYSARLSDMEPVPQFSNRTRHVCPEVYFGNRYDSPYNQHGMEPEQCSYVPPFDSVLTVVLPASKWKADRVNFVAKQIRKHYDNPLLAIVSSDFEIDEGIVNITIKKTKEHHSEGKFINEVMKGITTPYVLFATDVVHFNNQSSLERLVRILDELEQVQVVGGAVRDLQGRWIHGCLQQKMANYQAFYSMGYYYSKYECMYCDDLLTPFVTTVQLIKNIPFAKGLSGPALFRDWFANVRSAGHLAMICPDVMFYVNNHTTMSKDDWLKVAKKWSLENIHSYDDNLHNFSCESVGISCKNPLGIIKSFLLPPCCIALMEQYLSYLTDYGQNNNLAYELQAGSALGAMKMGGYLPWDYDTDIVFECKDYDTWLKADKVLKPKGCHTTVSQKNKYLTVHCPFFFLELYCHHLNDTSQQFLPQEYQSTPTMISYSGKDVIVNSNPGLHSRNRMGIDSLKHAAHWRTLKVSNIGKAKGGYENPGVWNPCKKPKHHSCLDLFPGDGSLPFRQPFIKL